MKKRKIQKIGNSYMVSIPTEAIKRLNLKAGSEVDFTFSDGTSLIYETKVNKKSLHEYGGSFDIPGFNLMEAINLYKTDQYEEKLKRSYGKNLSGF